MVGERPDELLSGHTGCTQDSDSDGARFDHVSHDNKTKGGKSRQAWS
jgi:hypothetical protein